MSTVTVCACYVTLQSRANAFRRMIVPALHRRYIASMVDMFGDSTLHCVRNLATATQGGSTSVNMENYYSRLGLDIIGKAVFNYDFDSLSKDDAVIEAVYTTLREAEHRSLCPLPYWKLPGAIDLVPRQVRPSAPTELTRILRRHIYCKLDTAACLIRA